MTMHKPRIRRGPHYVYCVIGTDGSFISEAFWWKENAEERCPSGCRVERFRLVRDSARKRKKARR